MHQLEQHAVGIAVDDAGNGRMRIVADRIGAFARRGGDPRRRARTGARSIMRIGAVDQRQRGYFRRERDRSAGDAREVGDLLRRSEATRPVRREGGSTSGGAAGICVLRSNRSEATRAVLSFAPLTRMGAKLVSVIVAADPFVVPAKAARRFSGPS
jgi:hypothetical protein